MLHGLYWLTANVAARRPLLLVIDDLHWCDPPSLRWLAYVLPRLDGLDLSLVVGLRPASRERTPLSSARSSSDPLATVHPAGSPERRRQPAGWCARRCRRMPTRPSARPVTRSPAEIRCSCTSCSTRSRAEDVGPDGRQRVPGLRELAARAGWRAVSLRLSRLPPEATRLAQAIAILGDDVDPYHAAALADLDEEAGLEGDRPTSRASMSFARSPRSASSIRSSARPSTKSSHRSSGTAGTRVQRTSSSRPERSPSASPPTSCSSRRRSSPSHGRSVVAVLRDAARAARSRGASDSALAYLRRALAEPPACDAARRAAARARLRRGARERRGRGRASPGGARPRRRPRPEGEHRVLLGRQLFFLRPDESVAVFEEALDELGGADAELESILEAELWSVTRSSSRGSTRRPSSAWSASAACPTRRSARRGGCWRCWRTSIPAPTRLRSGP